MPKCDSFTKYIPATFAWVLLLGTTTLFFYFPCQWFYFPYPWVPAYQGVITLFVIANFTLATFMDPGVIPRASPEEDREDDFRAPLYKNVEINGITVRMKWCVTCQFYRPPRCSHCSVCNVCIETFDHHCPWVNNCIGRRNYRFFFMFLISLSIHITSIFTLCLVFVLTTAKDRLTDVDSIIAMVIIAIIVLLVIPIYGLTGFHIVLVSRGRTTNEQVTGKFKGGYNPFSRGCPRNCCYILCGPQYPSLLKASKYVGKPKRYPLSASAISTITNENQVKTYMDNSNGVRNASSNAYNKLSPGRGEGSDTDMEPTASQSQDCEPTPPLQRHGSKSNFFLPPVEGGDSPRKGSHPQQQQQQIRGPFARGSPHPRPSCYRGMEVSQSRSHTPDPLSPDQQQQVQSPAQRGPGPSPTMQQRIKAIGVPTPLAMSSPVRRSNPGTPTQPRRPDFIGVGGIAGGPPSYYDFQHQQQHMGGHPHHGGQPHGGGGRVAPGGTYGSPQRRFLSEGELVRQGGSGDLAYSRTNNTVDNIRELAGSPQRGVYMWKDTSPGAYVSGGNGVAGPVHHHQQHQRPGVYDYYRSNPTSPTQQQQQQQQQQLYGQRQPASSYYPPVRGGVPVYPPPQSPQIKRKTMATPTTPTSTVMSTCDGGRRPSPGSRRPMSFVRALEMTDSMELTSASPGTPRTEHRGLVAVGGPMGGTPTSVVQDPHRSSTPTPDRASVYDMNYEISV